MEEEKIRSRIFLARNSDNLDSTNNHDNAMYDCTLVFYEIKANHWYISPKFIIVIRYTILLNSAIAFYITRKKLYLLCY